jgi:uncharacterized membrane protein
MSTATSATLTDDRIARWVVLVSLALNLFFVGATGALLARHYFAPSETSSSPIDRSVAARIDRLAQTLPSLDAEILRAEFRNKAATVEGALDAYRRAQETVRQSFRAEAFNADAMRAAMTEMRARRQTFDQSLHDVIGSAAIKMSAAGRNKLASWPPSQPGTGSPAR